MQRFLERLKKIADSHGLPRFTRCQKDHLGTERSQPLSYCTPFKPRVTRYSNAFCIAVAYDQNRSESAVALENFRKFLVESGLGRGCQEDDRFLRQDQLRDLMVQQLVKE